MKKALSRKKMKIKIIQGKQKLMQERQINNSVLCSLVMKYAYILIML